LYRRLLLLGRPGIFFAMLRVGDIAPDFSVGVGTLYQILKRGGAAVFFFPKAFTPG
jgi:peroxiredoxin